MLLYLLLSWLLMGNIPLSTSSTDEPYFRGYQTEHGLLHNSVNCVLQDSSGFMWVGSQNGLNRFDGHSFDTYALPDNKFYLGGNMVYSLHEDLDNQLWVGTSQGLYYLDRQTDKLTRLMNKTKFHVSISTAVITMTQTADGTLWIGTSGQGLFRYHPHTESFIQVSTQGSYISHIVEDKAHGRVIVATLDNGLVAYPVNDQRVGEVIPLSGIERNAEEVRFLQYRDGKVWFGLSANIIGVLDGQELTTIENPEIGVIRCAANGADGTILFGTDKGIYSFHPENQRFVHLTGYTDNASVSLNQMVNAICVDQDDGLWIATNQSGLLYKKEEFLRLRTYLPSQLLGSSDNFVETCVEDKDGNIFIGTQTGLFCLRAGEEQLQAIGPRNLEVSSLLFNNQELWIGTNGKGILVLELTTGKIIRTITQTGKGNSLSSNNITALYKDKKGRIFVGTRLGLGVYNAMNGEFRPLSVAGTMVSVTCIKEDHLGHLWVASENAGLFRIDGNNHYHYQHYFHLGGGEGEIPSNSITSIEIGPRGKIWIGTNGSGIFYFDPGSDSFIDANERLNQSANAIIYAIQEDEKGYLWLATSEGVIRSSQETFYLFDLTDGLRSSVFSANAVISQNDGTVYFGGDNGLTAFEPNQSRLDIREPEAVVTSVKVLQSGAKSGKTVSTGGYARRGMMFAHHENNLEFSFSTLSFKKSNRHLYRYMLSGVDEEWRLLENKNNIEYTNLPPGKYTLYVWSNTDNVHWSEEPTTLTFQISAPWWQTPWSYGACTLVFSLGLVVGVRKINDLHLRAYQKKLDSYKQKKEHDLYQSKVRFFVNLVHEIRTPLTLISVPLQRMQMTRLSEDDRLRYVNVMDKNLNHLMGIVNDLLDFQKMEDTQPILKKDKVDLVSFISSFKTHFETTANIRQIEIIADLPHESIWCIVDKDALTKVLFNMVGNALKNTRDTIALSVQQARRGIAIEVKDNGKGFPSGETDRLFEPFSQLSNAQKGQGTGLGLFYSKILLDAMGAQIETKNNEWGGASVLIRLNEDDSIRIPEQNRDDQNGQILTNESIVDSQQHVRAHVLLVEDNLELRAVLKEALQDDHMVSVAENGADALDTLSSHAIDLIICDVMMPQMDGLTFTSLLRSDIKYCHIPLILLTARTDTQCKEGAMTLGADVYLEKPVSLIQLKFQVRNLLMRQHHQQRKIQEELLLQNRKDGLSTRDEEFISQLLSTIDARIADLDFCIDDLAEKVNMSRSNFYRKIKGLTGLSPNAYLRLVRLKRSVELLQTEGCRINEVYQQVGFSSSSYFAKCFRSQYGLSPSEYLNKIAIDTPLHSN